MKHKILIINILLLISLSAFAKPKVLVFSKTMGFHHASIAVGVTAIMKLGKENNFDVDTTTDSKKFTYDNLKQYAAVIFLSTTGDVLNDAQQAEFEKYIRAGGGFVGVHAATDTEYDWAWYGNLVGAYFKSHPAQQMATLHIIDHNFVATKNLPDEWKRFDEWYNYKWIAPNLHVLITIDEKSYTGGANGDNHPMSWYHEYDGGRAFYTELGHTDESYSDPLYLGHLLGGIKYAMGVK
ncbi:ThuA domain-containing protein [Mucilaginibacter gotjawali]|uniref:Trehalose utilization n=2 Tax=Mucilaginibacter gotjawali TaxID=1550579 RepID=A0A0X8X2T3_9SPHI|nr:ThuA domain-containing protein [Mucilaginibacter gotjawali]MBB3055852.1 type 1 glutamine amidotransferase [Mucilaginibacter gotjawali]BAU54674.1 Trehalose utilization [Mucilaginibacter gotjawali]